MITPAQLRAARALLDWSREDCSKAVGVSTMTIKNIEGGKMNPHHATLEKIIHTFSSNGVEFVAVNDFSKFDLSISGVAFIAPKEPFGPVAMEKNEQGFAADEQQQLTGGEA